jgi:hypothetical protein
MQNQHHNLSDFFSIILKKKTIACKQMKDNLKKKSAKLLCPPIMLLVSYCTIYQHLVHRLINNTLYISVFV